MKFQLKRKKQASIAKLYEIFDISPGRIHPNMWNLRIYINFYKLLKKKFIPLKLKDLLKMLEIGFKIFMDFSTKLGSSNSAFSNASKYNFPPSTPRKQVVDTIIRKHF